ncbi:MAG TPA: DUF4079 domain-containing protein [Oscillatoriales cyanobacterium M59_W2019_021]|nr:DUF4079 domain-containing protein [Oscillatoriales cyanobacterium M4454_W2019_049]HIK50822.1 DUF4079 domain-containing protein [Oscillatoriales cyanobacterium M59_W2019_021]
MDLPSFIWLWRIAAWSMGFSLLMYVLLAVTGGSLFWHRQAQQPRPRWWRSLHIAFGSILVGLVLLLLAVGIIGTLGHFGSLGHSPHLFAGLTVVALVLISAASATQIHPRHPWVRHLHIGTNIALLGALAWVLLTGWVVVQKYLP